MRIQDLYIFTPGPWKADEGTIRNQAGDALGSYPWGIGGAVDHGNGVLMAAAPELLAACSLTLRTINDVLRHYEANAKSNRETLEDIARLLRGLVIRYKEDRMPKDEKQENNHMMGDVETYINRYGDLAIEALPGIDWKSLEEMPHDIALAELLEYQTANGYEWLLPEEIGALTDAPIIAWGVERDKNGIFQKAAAVYWFSDYQIKDAIKALKGGETVIFKQA